MIFEKLPLISYIILTVILSCWLIYLKSKKVNTGLESKKNNSSKRWFLPLFLLILLLWIYELSRAAVGFSMKLLPDFLTAQLTDSSYLKGFGTVYIVIGLFAFALTLRHFGSSLRFGLNRENKGKLVTSGIFSLSRNPFFLSLEIYFLGVTLILPSIFFIGFTLSAFIGIHYFILKEEKFMAENYGEEYHNYQQKTRRYL